MHSPGTSDSVDSGPSNEALRAWASLQCGDVDDIEPLGLGGETRLMSREELLDTKEVAAEQGPDAEDSPSRRELGVVEGA